MSALEVEKEHVPDQLVDQLAKGWDALSVEIKVLDEQRRELENKLSWAKQQYLDALKRFSPQTSSQEFRTFLDELDEAGIVQAENSQDWLTTAQRSSDSERQSRVYSIQRASDAREKIGFRRRASDAAASPSVRIWNGKSADVLDSPLERDFTTYNGNNTGRLYCPFVAPKQRSSLANPITMNGNGAHGMNGHRTPRGSSISRGSISGRRSKRSSFHDPIRAEICGLDDRNSGTPSIEGSAPLCPIRFLDQHSPEEVAQYFEKHKHELPPSHELCVKRYQSNEASIRELDAKYGNLVTMIQGLGQVHQPMLPETPDEEAIDDSPHPDPRNRVEKWATTVGGSLQGVDDIAATIEAADEEDERQPHFDRDLKDVRVGESPSRPWGITVPEIAGEDIATKSDHTASPRDTPVPQTLPDTAGRGKCPFDHKAMMAGGLPNMPGMHNLTPSNPKPEEPNSMQAETGHTPAPARPAVPPPTAKAVAFTPTATTPPPPQLVFNGPVFFGYDMTQAMAMLQQSNFGKPAVA